MLMPVMFIFLFMGFPAGLVLYWSTQSLYQLIQQMIMTRNVPGAGLRLGELWPFKSSGKTQKPKPKPQPQPQMAAAAPVAGASGFEDAETRRALAEKRRRRRRKKKKRR
jgi:membrane protein insertase Oxa1/YidC/SpoIIIJ